MNESDISKMMQRVKKSKNGKGNSGKTFTMKWETLCQRQEV